MTVGDYHQLLVLLCSDFPRSIIEAATVRITPTSQPLTYGTLSKAVYIYVFFSEFFIGAWNIFKQHGHPYQGDDGDGDSDDDGDEAVATGEGEQEGCEGKGVVGGKLSSRKRRDWNATTVTIMPALECLCSRCTEASLVLLQQLRAHVSMTESPSGTRRTISYNRMLISLLQDSVLGSEVTLSPAIVYGTQRLEEAIEQLEVGSQSTRQAHSEPREKEKSKKKKKGTR